MTYPEITHDTRYGLQAVADRIGRSIMFKEGVCKGGPFVGCFDAYTEVAWRPDADPGDAMALAAKLRTSFSWNANAVRARNANGIEVVDVVTQGEDPVKVLVSALWAAAVLFVGCKPPACVVRPPEAVLELPMLADDPMGSGKQFALYAVEYEIPGRAMAQSAYLYATSQADAAKRANAMYGVVPNDTRRLCGQTRV